MNNRGFILLDALLSVFIVAMLTLITMNVYQSYKTYKDGYNSYQEEMENQYLNIYSSLGECEKCVMKEETEDSSALEDY